MLQILYNIFAKKKRVCNYKNVFLYIADASILIIREYTFSQLFKKQKQKNSVTFSLLSDAVGKLKNIQKTTVIHFSICFFFLFICRWRRW